MESKSLAVQTSQEVKVFNFFDKEQFDTMQRVCKMFASSELVPDMYKTNLAPDKTGNPTNPENKAMANCMIAIEMAQRIGASPLMIMQNMVIIYGRPSWSSKFLIATVNTSGRFEPLKYRITNLGRVGKMTITTYEKKWVNGTNGGKGYYSNEAKSVEFDGTQIDNLECVAYTTAKGSDEVLESSPIDIKMSIQEGWYTKNGSKWQTMTRQMLMYRAASFWTNAYAPELSMGMKTEDEIRDIIDIDYEDVTDKLNGDKANNANKTVFPEPKPEPKPEPPTAPQQPGNNPENPEPAKEEPKSGLFPEGEVPTTRQRKF